MASKADIEVGAGSSGKAGANDVWHVLDVKATLDTLRTSKKGLSTAQASELFKQYGPNELTEKKKKTLLERIWNQVNNVLVGILAVVAVVSASKVRDFAAASLWRGFHFPRIGSSVDLT